MRWWSLINVGMISLIYLNFKHEFYTLSFFTILGLKQVLNLFFRIWSWIRPLHRSPEMITNFQLNRAKSAYKCFILGKMNDIWYKKWAKQLNLSRRKKLYIKNLNTKTTTLMKRLYFVLYKNFRINFSLLYLIDFIFYPNLLKICMKTINLSLDKYFGKWYSEFIYVYRSQEQTALAKTSESTQYSSKKIIFL